MANSIRGMMQKWGTVSAGVSVQIAVQSAHTPPPQGPRAPSLCTRPGNGHCTRKSTACRLGTAARDVTRERSLHAATSLSPVYSSCADAARAQPDFLFFTVLQGGIMT